MADFQGIMHLDIQALKTSIGIASVGFSFYSLDSLLQHGRFVPMSTDDVLVFINFLSLFMVGVMLVELRRRRKKRCNKRRWGSISGGGLPPWFMNDFDL